MKKILILIMIMFLLVGCSSTSQKQTTVKEDTTVAEDLKDVTDDLKETGEELKDTLTDTFTDAFSDVFGSSSKEENTVTEDNEQVESEVVEEQEPVEEIEYIKVSVDEMYETLNDNALKAKKTYENQYVEVTGILGTIDSNGRYICLEEMNTAYSFNSVQCYIKNDDQLDFVMNMSSGKKYTVRIKVTSIGEFLGYSGDIIEFVE